LYHYKIRKCRVISCEVVILKGFLIYALIILLIAGLGITSGCAQKKKDDKEPIKDDERPDSREREGDFMPDQTLFVLESSAFSNNDEIPVKYAAAKVPGGENVSIPLSWRDAPEDTKSFAITIIDHHPVANNFVHWVVINIPSDINSVPGGVSGSAQMPEGTKELINMAGYVGYHGPAAPPGTGPHDYEVTVYALNVDTINLSGEVTENQLERALEGKVVASAKIVGKVER